MLQLTRDGEYAVRALLHLASLPEGAISLVDDISAAQGVPRSYLSKILQQLRKVGLVRSRRGAKGGFMLARPAAEITLLETIEAVEGPINLNICLSGDGCGHDDTCPVHPVWREAQKKLRAVLKGKNMAQLAADAVNLRKGRGASSRDGPGEVKKKGKIF